MDVMGVVITKTDVVCNVSDPAGYVAQDRSHQRKWTQFHDMQ